MPQSAKEWVGSPTLRGSVVRLEPLEERHAAAMLAAAEPSLFQHTPQAPSEWTVAGFVDQIRGLSALRDVVALALLLDRTGELIGRTTFMDIKPEHRGLEIGRTWIARRHQGTAANPEMKFLLLRYAFEELGAGRVQFTTGAGNLHSQRAIAKLGAVREGLLRRNRVLPDGTLRDTVIYSIIAEEWQPAGGGVKQSLLARLAGLSAPGR